VHSPGKGDLNVYAYVHGRILVAADLTGLDDKTGFWSGVADNLVKRGEGIVQGVTAIAQGRVGVGDIATGIVAGVGSSIKRTGEAGGDLVYYVANGAATAATDYKIANAATDALLGVADIVTAGVGAKSLASGLAKAGKTGVQAVKAAATDIAEHGVPVPVVGVGGGGVGGGVVRIGGKGVPKAVAEGTVPTAGETAATKAGRAAHKNYGTALGGEYETEVTLPSGKRVDAVHETLPEVRELKPDNPRAVQRGQKQVDAYARELESMDPQGRTWTGTVDTYQAPKKP
jgi:hypothetical protein